MNVPKIEENSTPANLVEVNVVTETKSHGLWLHKGETRFIDSRLAEYFTHHGWVKVVGTDQPAPMVPAAHTLEVQNGTHKSSATKPA